MTLSSGSAPPRALVEKLERDYGVETAQAWGMTEILGGSNVLLRPGSAELSFAERLDRRLKSGRTLCGSPVGAVLYAATSAPDTDWVVKLCDVHPDGRTLNVCDGILRARYRTSWDAPTLVEPGSVERYEIDLWATSQLFRAGHRIRVLVTSSDFPRYDRNPNTGALGVEAAALEPARQRIFRDADRASHLLLPIVA